MLCYLFLTISLLMATGPARAEVSWPLKTSVDGHYLVDQNNVPFLINGDSPQSLMRSLNKADVETYFANREQKGINAVWIHLMERRRALTVDMSKLSAPVAAKGSTLRLVSTQAQAESSPTRSQSCG